MEQEYFVVFPKQPTPMTLAVVVLADRMSEMATLERDRRMQLSEFGRPSRIMCD